MKFCPQHWDQLRSAIDESGLSALVAEDGKAAARNLASEMSDGRTVDNFDPLMGAHNAIVTVAMEFIRDRYQQNGLMLFADENEHPEWACPICALNWCHAEHDRLCKQEGCNYPPGYTYDEYMIENAVAGQKKAWQELKP